MGFAHHDDPLGIWGGVRLDDRNRVLLLRSCCETSAHQDGITVLFDQPEICGHGIVLRQDGQALTHMLAGTTVDVGSCWFASLEIRYRS
jgi:hypothetical protein